MLFCVFDTETTGLPFHPQAPIHQQPRVIEFGGVVTDGKKVLDQLEFVCNPGVQIEQIITDITGLTNDDLADKPPFSHFIPQVAEYFGSGQGRIAHNLSFDKSMLQFDLIRLGMTLDAIYWDSTDLPAIEICTVEQTVALYGKPMKLQALYNELVGDMIQEHRGMADVLALHEVCKRIGVYDILIDLA